MDETQTAFHTDALHLQDSVHNSETHLLEDAPETFFYRIIPVGCLDSRGREGVEKLFFLLPFSQTNPGIRAV